VIQSLDSVRPFWIVASSYTTTTPLATAADIVKGPSLLRTSHRARPRPSLLHLPGLRSLPYWTQVKAGNPANIVAYGDPSVSAVVQHLDAHWESILQEFNAVSSTLPSDYQTDTEHHILHDGKWDWHSYMTKGVVVNGQKAAFLDKFPVTTSVLNALRSGNEDTASSLCSNQLFEGTPFGYAFFSTLHSQSSIKAHTAPMNFRLRIHLPLSVPLSAPDATERPTCGMRVGNVVREWTKGKSLVLDDSFEHEVWNDTAERRVLLLVDVWHPDVTLQERQEIIAMFQDAKEKGWLS
jgi:Aspartyl/Asparaginyl beta-hydroxylase